MSVSEAVQKLIKDRLKSESSVSALVGGRVYDRPPKDASMPYISFGPSDSVLVEGGCTLLTDETIQIDVWSNDQPGKLETKRICDAVRRAVHEFDGELEVGALIDLRVVGVRVFEDQDPSVTHGVVTVTAQVED